MRPNESRERQSHEVVREEIDRTLRHYALKENLQKEVGNLRTEFRDNLIKVVIALATMQLVGLGAVAAIIKLLG